MSNNMRWELPSYVMCGDINVIYYLKCNTCGIRKHILENWLMIVFLTLKAESINTLVNVEWEFRLLNFSYM